MPAKSEKQRRFMGAELSRKRAGERTRTNMSEDKLSEFASKEFVIKDTLDFIDNYIKKAPYHPGLGFVPDNETKPIKRIRRVHPSQPSDEVIRDRLRGKTHGRSLEGIKERLDAAEASGEPYSREKPYSYDAAEAFKNHGVPSPPTEKEIRDRKRQNPNRRPSYLSLRNKKEEINQTADNAARLELSSEFTSKQKLDWRGAWVGDSASSKRNVGLNRAIATESRGIAEAARKEKQKRHAAKYGKNPFQKEEVTDMNYQDFISKLDGHINHLEKKRRMYTPEESRESFDRMYEKEQRQRDFDHDNELRRRKGQPEKPVTHVDRSVKFRDLETKQGDDDTPQNAEFQAAIASNKAEANALRAEERADVARREAYARRNRVQDAELFGTEEEYQAALASVTAEDKELMESGYPSETRNIDQPNFAVTKSKTLHSKDLLPVQDSNGNFVPNGTIPFTQETDTLMSLAADAIETYVMKDYADDNEVDTKAARRNKRKASRRKMKISGAGARDSQRIIGRKAAKARGELVD